MNADRSESVVKRKLTNWQRLGITIMEAATLMFVLLVIAAILFPLTACACGGSKKTVSFSNLKQAGLGALMYAGDYDDRFPAAEAWMDEIIPYTKSEPIFHDPILPKGEYGYAFRKKASKMKTDAPAHPEQFILLFETVLKGRNANSELWSLPRPGRLGNTDVVLFSDGHAKGFSTGDQEKGVINTLDPTLLADQNAGPVKPVGK